MNTQATKTFRPEDYLNQAPRVVIDEQEEEVFVHFQHITHGALLQTGLDNRWYVVFTSRDLMETVLTDLSLDAEELEHHCWGYAEPRAVDARDFIKALRASSIDCSFV